MEALLVALALSAGQHDIFIAVGDDARSASILDALNRNWDTAGSSGFEHRMAMLQNSVRQRVRIVPYEEHGRGLTPYVSFGRGHWRRVLVDLPDNVLWLYWLDAMIDQHTDRHYRRVDRIRRWNNLVALRYWDLEYRRRGEFICHAIETGAIEDCWCCDEDGEWLDWCGCEWLYDIAVLEEHGYVQTHMLLLSVPRAKTFPVRVLEGEIE